MVKPLKGEHMDTVDMLPEVPSHFGCIQRRLLIILS